MVEKLLTWEEFTSKQETLINIINNTHEDIKILEEQLIELDITASQAIEELNELQIEYYGEDDQ